MNSFHLICLFISLSLYGKATILQYSNSNIILDSIYEPNIFQMEAALSVDITLKTFDGTGYTITWEDDVMETISSAVIASHEYLTPYSESIKIEVNGFNVKELIISGGFAFNIQQLYDFAPRLQSLTINGGSACYGNLAQKPTSLTYIDIQTGAFYGNFNEGRLKNVERLRVVDGNTITFDLADFDTTIKYIGVTGENTAIGYIDSLNYPLLDHFDVKGQNTITGDLGMIQVPLPHVFVLRGNNTVDQYTSGNLTFSSIPNNFILTSPNNSLSTTEIDALLIDFDSITTSWDPPGFIFLTGAHEAPSVNSAAARASLIEKGATIATN